MSSLVLCDAMLSVDLDEKVRVKVDANPEDPEDESIYITILVGEEDEEDEICFAIDRANAGRWDKILREAADGVLTTAEDFHRKFDSLNVDGVDGSPA